MPEVSVVSWLQVDDVCGKLQIQHFEGLSASAAPQDAAAFGSKLAAIIADPAQYIALTPARVQQQERQRAFQRTMKYVAYGALVVTGVTVVTVVVTHRMQASSKRGDESRGTDSAGGAGGRLTARQSGGGQGAQAGSAQGSHAGSGSASGWWTWQK